LRRQCLVFGLAEYDKKIYKKFTSPAAMFAEAMSGFWSGGGALYTPPPIPTGLLLDSWNPTRLD